MQIHSAVSLDSAASRDGRSIDVVADHPAGVDEKADTLDRMTESQASASAAPTPADAIYLTDAVVRLERAIGRIGNKRLAPWNLSLSGYAALKILQTRTDLSLAQLSRRCFVRSQTMTRIVTQLEERGYVSRRPHPESERAIALALTDLGRTAIEDMDAEVLKINETLTRELDADGVAFLESALRRCAVAVEAELRDM
ncbi:MarR family winged helix-turn-helix transcriptional regulator [Rhodococcus triatomae]|nr:regulatory protein MarR [Rhodococcus triatomae BKS 15-14]